VARSVPPPQAAAPTLDAVPDLLSALDGNSPPLVPKPTLTSHRANYPAVPRESKPSPYDQNSMAGPSRLGAASSALKQASSPFGHPKSSRISSSSARDVSTALMDRKPNIPDQKPFRFDSKSRNAAWSKQDVIPISSGSDSEVEVLSEDAIPADMRKVTNRSNPFLLHDDEDDSVPSHSSGQSSSGDWQIRPPAPPPLPRVLHSTKVAVLKNEYVQVLNEYATLQRS
jgi:hypothetical protein